MRLAVIPWSVVYMLMVRIMYMLVDMFQFFVHMRVFVTFRQVQPNAEHHQAPASQKTVPGRSPSMASARAAPKYGATKK